MRSVLASLFAGILLVAIPVWAFQISAPQSMPAPQGTSLIQQSLAAQTGGAPVNDVTMTGNVTVTKGSTSESGTITLVATAAGQSQVTLTLPSGTRSETRMVSAGSPALSVKGADGATFSVQTQSALSPEPGWFYPAFVIANGLSSSTYTSSDVGQEIWNGVTVQHLAVWLVTTATLPAPAPYLQQVSQHDLYLDPLSLLPVAMKFNVHPYDPRDPNRTLVSYNGVNVDQQVQVRFSDYRQVGGRRVAFHIQTTTDTGFKNIIEDIQLSSVSFNTGVTIAAN